MIKKLKIFWKVTQLFFSLVWAGLSQKSIDWYGKLQKMIGILKDVQEILPAPVPKEPTNFRNFLKRLKKKVWKCS